MTWNPLYASLEGSNLTEEAFFFNMSKLLDTASSSPNILTASVINSFDNWKPSTIPDLSWIKPPDFSDTGQRLIGGVAGGAVSALLNTTVMPAVLLLGGALIFRKDISRIARKII